MRKVFYIFLHSYSFLFLPYRPMAMNPLPKKELLISANQSAINSLSN
ncbi:MAG: hypothetical protein IPI69_14250 [Bacteroidales bacterium]|nr:hypothetical protein [Bacteroidales bacterium]